MTAQISNNGPAAVPTRQMGGLSLDTSSANNIATTGASYSTSTSPNSPQRSQSGYHPDQLHPHSHSHALHAIVETDNDEVSSNTGDEEGLTGQEEGGAGAGDSDDNEERREIGGDMRREMAVKGGYLLKKGERRKNWKKRYFVLRPDRLCYYKNEKEYQILRNISIADVHACAQVEVKKHDNSFGIVTARRTYYVRADSRHEADDWVLKINGTRKEQEARLQAEKEQQQQQQQNQNNEHTPIAGTPFSGPSETDLPQSIEQQAQLPVPGASSGSAVPIPISGGGPGGLAPGNMISSASDSAGFLSTSASSSAGGGGAGAGGANYLSSSWASSSSEQSNPSFQPGAFGRTGTFRANSTSIPSGSQSAVATQKWPDIPVNVGDGLLSTDGGLVDDPRLLPPADPHATARDRAQQTNILSSSEEDEAPTPSGPHSTSPPRPAAITGTAAVQTSPSAPAAAGGSAAATANPQRVILAGYLMKQGKRKSWRKRWFSLYSNRLVYTRSHMDRKVHREIRLDSILDAMECDEPKSKSRTFGGVGGGGGNPLSPSLPSSPPSFLPAGGGGSGIGDSSAGNTGAGGLLAEGGANCFKIITPSRSYVVCAPSEEEEIKWLSAIRVLLDKSRASHHPSAAAAGAA